MPLSSTVEEFRRKYRAQNVGPRYRGWAHYGGTALGALVGSLYGLLQLDGVTWMDALVVPGGILFANAAEYLAHRHVMHKPVSVLRILFERHTQHHHFYTKEVMAADSMKDWKIVLFPPASFVFFLGFIATPVCLLLFAVVSRNAGWLFFCVALLYFLTYESLHLSYHLPPDSWVGRRWLIRVLRRHHTRHHDLQLMARANFNTSFPICDTAFGTLK